MATDVKVGDKVNYVPDVSHAFERIADGGFCWEFAGPKGTMTTDQVVNTIRYLRSLRGKHDPRKDKLLVPTKPRTTYPGVVTAVNDDGTVNLDAAGQPGVTMHYRNISVDAVKKAAHTCHPKENA